MRRLNVRFSQIEECISKALFAVDQLPRTHELYSGELLLLQLVKADATRMKKEKSRIDFALIFDHAEEDVDGSASRLHWPKAGKVWKYILHCRDTLPAIPFSLDELGLSKSYSGETQCMFIEPRDEMIVLTYFQPPAEVLAASKPKHVPLLYAIRNQDKILQLTSDRTVEVAAHTRTVSEAWIPSALKELYDHRCQICSHDFRPRYSVPYADTRYLKKPEKRADRTSGNVIVVCPNHDAIIAAADPRFDRVALAFQYENGLVETLQLRDHLLG